MSSPREQFLTLYAKEHSTTMRVLRAYPEEQRDLKPSERSKTARQLAWIFVGEQGLMEKALTTGFDWSKPPVAPPEPPETMREIADAFDAGHRTIAALVRGMPDDELASRTASFFVAPRTLGDIPLLDFLWFMLLDQVHHRGQLSVYLRMAGAKVPSIYGPTADEPWV